MTGLPNEFFQVWSHSFEEDSEEARVYRPNSFEFPPARGRAGIEFRSDGTFIDWTIAQTDALEPITGYWQVVDPTHVRVYFEDDIRPARVLEIVQSDKDVLKIKAG